MSKLQIMVIESALKIMFQSCSHVNHSFDLVYLDESLSKDVDDWHNQCSEDNSVVRELLSKLALQ